MIEPMDTGRGEDAVSDSDRDELATLDTASADPSSAVGDPHALSKRDGDDGLTGRPDAVELPAADVSLLALVDRLTRVLERSDLGELEVTAGGTTIILRSPGALAQLGASPAPLTVADAAPAGLDPDRGVAHLDAPPPGAPEAPSRPSVKAPLTGIYYGAPSPGATPYVSVGDHVSVGQIIGLIEAMKLFNEIKSDLAGRVVRVCADNGALVKARQPLIEVEPA
jgi:acetyl-CoA carboxylase biotin carboxyl carrier protein